MDKCSVGQKYNSSAKTCFSLRQAKVLANAYNNMLQMSRVNIKGQKYENLDPIVVSDSSTVVDLMRELRKRFNDVCPDGSDSCLLKQEMMNTIVMHQREDLEMAILPEGPEKATGWLSNDEIDFIMKPYQKVKPDFYYLGTSYSNCNKYPGCELYRVDFDSHMKSGIKYFGTILNLDSRGQDGSHWVSIYIDTVSKRVYYCDSNGKKPNSNIQNFIDEAINNLNRLDNSNEYVAIINKKKFQNDSSECGVYSCNFIIRMMSGEPYEQIINTPLDFRSINSCRSVYFSNYPKKDQVVAHAKCRAL
jgi:hypothetical protein